MITITVMTIARPRRLAKELERLNRAGFVRTLLSGLDRPAHTYIYIYIYIMCMCVCVYIHIYIYIYIYTYNVYNV